MFYFEHFQYSNDLGTIECHQTKIISKLDLELQFSAFRTGKLLESINEILDASFR